MWMVGGVFFFLLEQYSVVPQKSFNKSFTLLPVPDSTRSGDAEGPFQTLEAPSYRDFRAEAYQHHKLRDECFKKAALAFSNKQGQLAQFYAQQVYVNADFELQSVLRNGVVSYLIEQASGLTKRTIERTKITMDLARKAI